MATQLSDHFSLEELTVTDNRELFQSNREEAECSPLITANLKRVANELLEPIRSLFNTSIFVHSGYRGEKLNESVGGSKTSQHCKGEAVDFLPSGVSSDDEIKEAFYRIIKSLPDLQFGQLLIEHGTLHISLGTKRECAYYDVQTKSKVIINV